MAKISAKRQAIMDMDSNDYKAQFNEAYNKYEFPLAPPSSDIIRYKDSGVAPAKAAEKYYSKVFGREFRRVTTLAKHDLEASNQQTFKAKIDFIANSTTPLPSKLLNRKEVVDAFKQALNPIS